VELVALPADRRPRAASALDDLGRAPQGEPRPRPKTRATQRLEKAQLAAFIALRAVSSYAETQVELPIFFGRLSETIAQLVGARRAAFWRLGPDGTLAVQPQPYGFTAASPINHVRIRPEAHRESVVERVIFRDELDLVGGTSAELDAFWQAHGLVGIRNSIAVSWRAGDRHIGALAAHDSRRGFRNDDVWVLRVAAMATGLMWQYTEATQQLDTTVKRLEQAAAARRQLLGNVAAGGDEARRRFASSLHDDSLQLLTAAELQLERTRMERDPIQLAAQLDQLKVTLKQVEDSLRRLLMNVSPQAMELPLGLAEAIRVRLDSLRTHTGIEPDIDLRFPAQIPEAISSVIFKNISEALTNVEKHAHATRIRVSAHAADGGIRVVVADDGKGFIVAESMYVPGHLGLTAIRERAQLAGGRCRIESEPGAGARVEFWVPISL
jgi:signal transduction histidine kinase